MDIVIPDPETSWRAEDLSKFTEDEGIPAPDILLRTDDTGLFYRGRTNVLFGESESGKTWLALLAAAQEVEAGRNVIFYDFEDDRANARERLEALGVRNLSLVHYARVEGPLEPAVMEATIKPQVLDLLPSLVIIDSMDELLAMHGASPNDSQQVRAIRQKVIDPIKAMGPSLVVIDHQSKVMTGKGPTGSQAKLSQVSGAVLHVSVSAPWGRGSSGAGQLHIVKDRPGHLRGRAAEGKYISRIEYESDQDGGMSISLIPPTTLPGSNQYMSTFLIEGLVEALAAAPRQQAKSARVLIRLFRENGGQGNNEKVGEAIAHAIQIGKLRRDEDGIITLGNTTEGDGVEPS